MSPLTPMVTRATYPQWIERLNTITPHERELQRANCAILGHVPAGDQFMMAHPIDMCYFCIEEFRQCPDCPQCQREKAFADARERHPG